jgi:hypothetical protein
MALGKDNRFVLNLGREITFTGDTNTNALAGGHVVLPCDAILEDVRGSCYSVATTCVVQLIAGVGADVATAAKQVLSTTLSFTDTVLDATGVIKPAMVNFSKGQEFSLSEKTSADATVGVSVQLTFRAKGA